MSVLDPDISILGLARRSSAVSSGFSDKPSELDPLARPRADGDECDDMDRFDGTLACVVMGEKSMRKGHAVSGFP